MVDEKGPQVDRSAERPEGQAAPPAANKAQEEPQVQAELDELMDRLKRVTADYQNYQKRVVREMAEERRFANTQFAKDVLTVVDDLERAMAAGADSAAAGALLDGVRMTHEHLMAVLARHGVTVIEAQGRPFDPQYHEAMMQQPTDQTPPGTVLQELVKGYRMHDRTLRPAKVVVAAAPPEAPSAETGDQQ